jgi:hypothetical protein
MQDQVSLQYVGIDLHRRRTGLIPSPKNLGFQRPLSNLWKRQALIDAVRSGPWRSTVVKAFVSHCSARHGPVAVVGIHLSSVLDLERPAKNSILGRERYSVGGVP